MIEVSGMTAAQSQFCTDTSAEDGESMGNPADHAWFAEFVFRAINREIAKGGGTTNLARIWGVPEETLRAYRDAQSTPNATRLKQIIARCSQEDATDLLSSLQQRVILSLPPDDLPASLKPIDALHLAIAAVKGTARVLDDAERASSDGAISPDEAATLTNWIVRCKRTLDELLIVVSRCALRPQAATPSRVEGRRFLHRPERAEGHRSGLTLVAALILIAIFWSTAFLILFKLNGWLGEKWTWWWVTFPAWTFAGVWLFGRGLLWLYVRSIGWIEPDPFRDDDYRKGSR